MENKDIYILGVGHNTDVYIDLVESCGYNAIGLFHYNDERTGENVLGIPIINSRINLFKNESLVGMQFAISVGNNRIRANLASQIRKMGGKTPTIIHPSAVVSKYSQISVGVVIHANAVIQAGASIGEDTVVSYNASVTHTSMISKACYLAAYANVGAYVTIMDYVLIGQGAIIISSKVSYIGSNVIIGAGSVVTKDIEANTIVAGNPARLINTF